jgi:hypothetical protein
MTLEFKTQYLIAIRQRYFCGSKKRKTEILNELCQITGYNRKHAIRILSKGHMVGKKKSGRTRAYSPESIRHLKRLWHIMGRICSKKMVGGFPTWLNYYEHDDFDELIREELLSLSAATIDRYLKTYKTQFAGKKRSGTRRSKKFKNIIPIKDFDQKVQTPGYLQADTVAHCGGSMSGKFMWTLTLTDVHTGWTENRPMFQKIVPEMLEAMCCCFRKLPFTAASINTDNGSEFMNKEFYNMISRKHIEFTRSRPYRKNDNCYAEQKNFTHVRELFGYDRIGHQELYDIMWDIYKNYFNPLHNFFIPQIRSVKKVRIGAKYKRTYDKAKTPFERLMESDKLSNFEKNELQKRFDVLNPITLRKDLNNKLKYYRRRLNELNNPPEIEWWTAS